MRPVSYMNTSCIPSINAKAGPLIAAALAFLVVFMPLNAPPCCASNSNRIALVIGNADYVSGALRNPINDAIDMSTALKQCGFEVYQVLNATRSDMRDEIRSFGNQLGNRDIGLFYYAGHGIQVNGENYLVPVDAAVEAEDEVADECLKVASVLRKMETAKNPLNIIILDACRNNPFHRSFRSTTRGLAKMDAPTGSIIAYATAPGTTAADGSGENGLYTSILLKYISTNNMQIEEVLKRVRIEVAHVSQGKQIPWESSSLMGEFYFLPDGKETIVTKPHDDSDAKTRLNSESGPQSPRDLFKMARDANSKREKIKYLELVIKSDPGYVDAYRELAPAYAKNRQFDEAAQCYEKLLSLTESQLARYELGRIYQILGNEEKAIHNLRIASDMDNTLGRQAKRILANIEKRYD